jgi:L-fuculokinase
MNVIAIFDIGKTNKKLLLFDEQYQIVWEESCLIDETNDEDGDTCEDLEKLTTWITDALKSLEKAGHFSLRAINFSAYGASLVHIGADNRPVAPLYNYLKPYPETLREKFYNKYGGEITFSMQTASPVLGNLNSGMQLYRIKEERPELFDRIKVSLHLPQYFSWLMTGVPCSDITSIGCHSNLWNFSRHHYHEWVYREGIIDKLSPILPSVSVFPAILAPAGSMRSGKPSDCMAGIGLHDSSAAMIPYLESFREEQFVLISTGTWCISMNPFSGTSLTAAELQKDCLCYMSYEGKPVKSTRLFAGYEHEHQVRRLDEHFHKASGYYTMVNFDPAIVETLRSDPPTPQSDPPTLRSDPSKANGAERELAAYKTYEEAYHRLLMDIMEQQSASTRLILDGTDIKKIFVDGGFGKNAVFMHLLAASFPGIGVFAASIPRASAMGAALAIHRQWNSLPLPGGIIELRHYPLNSGS